MRVSDKMLQRWMETNVQLREPFRLDPKKRHIPVEDVNIYPPSVWCIYDGKRTTAKQCPYTMRTGQLCSMRHKGSEQPAHECCGSSFRWSNTNACTGRLVTWPNRTPQPNGRPECEFQQDWRCPGCIRQQDMLRREQRAREARAIEARTIESKKR